MRRESTLLCKGGFEPFGRDYQAGLASGALANDIYLRLPGQWEDGSWQESSSGAGIYYNVHRFLAAGIGRYTRPDPLGTAGGINLYSYVDSNPIKWVDLLGLVGSPSDCSCCSEQGTAQELAEILNYLKQNQRRYRFSLKRIFGSGCGGAADDAQQDIERDLKPACWVTKSQLTRPRSVVNRLSSRWTGVTPVVHRVVKLTPCTPSLFFGGDLGADVYFPWQGTNPLPPERQIDSPYDRCP